MSRVLNKTLIWTHCNCKTLGYSTFRQKWPYSHLHQFNLQFFEFLGLTIETDSRAINLSATEIERHDDMIHP